MSRLLRHLRFLTFRETLTVIHAFCVMVVVEVLVRTMRLPRVAKVMGSPLSLDMHDPEPFEQETINRLPLKARRRLWCADRIAIRWPFSEGPCLRRALVGGHLIRHHSPTIRLGVDVRNAAAEAHAWLEVDGAPLEDVSEFATFTRPSRSTDA